MNFDYINMKLFRSIQTVDAHMYLLRGRNCESDVNVKFHNFILKGSEILAIFN